MALFIVPRVAVTAFISNTKNAKSYAIQIFEALSAHPMEEFTDRLGVFLEKGDRLLVLGLCGRRALDARKIGFESG